MTTNQQPNMVKIGYNPATGKAVYLDTNLHTHIRGRSRSGKSLLATEIARRVIEDLDRPLIVIDQGADQAMFHSVRIVCDKDKFRFYSPAGRSQLTAYIF